MVIGLLTMVALAGEPMAGPAAPIRLELEVPAPVPPRCVGPLVPGAPPCRIAFTLGTQALLTTLQILRPVDMRLTRASSLSPVGEGMPVLRSGALTRPGLLFSGYSSDLTWVGLGSFDMRTPTPP